ncbi:MAG: leucine-rich repeat domain-containing protein [Oscillospiraceae bacterium]|nr:leucine-rich repeat domain-containing protein [Oscillospiraceae bacterium]
MFKLAKKAGVVVLAVAILAGLAGGILPILPSVKALDFNGIQYYCSEGRARISGYTGSQSSLTIPGSLPNPTDGNMYQVGAIDAFAFQNRLGLMSVTLPSSLTSIGQQAFQGCVMLRTINIPSKVINIGAGAFNGCTSLASVTVPGGVTTINANTFSDCRNLQTVTIQQGVQGINAEAFARCPSLMRVNIPRSVTLIRPDVFVDSPIVRIWGYKGTVAEAYAKGGGAVTSGGASRTIPFSIRVDPKVGTPKLSKQSKATHNVKKGKKLNLKLTAKNTGTGGTLKLQWQSSEKKKKGFKNIKKATKSSYRVPVKKTGTLYYRCRATHTVGNNSKSRISKVFKVTVRK